MGTLQNAAGAPYLAGMLSAQVVGQLVAMACAGFILDRSNRKLFLILVQGVTGACWVLFAVLLATSPQQQFPWILSSGLLGVLGGLNGPATQSLLAWLVAKDQMQQTVAKLRISLNTVALLMPALGGLALGFVSGAYVALVLALFMALSAITLCALPSAIGQNTQQDSSAGWRDALQPWFIAVVLLTGVMNLLWAGYFQLNGPKVFDHASQNGALHWGIVSTALAAGLILGGIYYKGYSFKRPLSTTVLLLAPKALPILLVALLAQWYWVAAAAFIAGFFLEAFAVNFYTQVQLRMPQRSLGTVLSLDGFIGLGLMPVGYALAGSTFAAGSLDLAGIAAAAATVLLAVCGWFILRSSKMSVDYSSEEPQKETAKS